VTINETHRAIADTLFNSDDAIVLLGNFTTTHPQLALLRTLSGEIAKLTHSKLGYLSEAVNSSGAWLSGAVPHRLTGGSKNSNIGLSSYEMLAQKLKAYLLLGVEPELDCWDTRLAQQAMQDADLVVALTAFQSEALNSYADVLLPIATFAETSGTYINNEGTVQCFNGAVPPQGEARPAWKVLRVLGNSFNVDGFDYESSTEVCDESIKAIGKIEGDNTDQWQLTVTAGAKKQGLQRITETPMNMIDSLTRRATSLQKTNDVADGAIHINSALAEKNKLANADDATVEQDKQQVTMKVIVDERVPDNCVLIQSAHPSQSELGGAFGSIKIGKR